MASVVLNQEILGRLESDSQNEMTLPAGVVIPFIHDEVRQALAEPGGRSLREIMADLRAQS